MPLATVGRATGHPTFRLALEADFADSEHAGSLVRAVCHPVLMPASPDQRQRVLIAFGEVMSIVQAWEEALEVVWWRTRRKHPNRPSGDFDTPRSQREVVRLERALQQKPIHEIKESIKSFLEPETAEELRDLIAARNRLTHRFLREQAVQDAGGSFKPGTVDLLDDLGSRFMRSYRSVMHTIMSFPEYDGPVLSHWPAIADRIVELAFSGDSIPRDPNAQ